MRTRSERALETLVAVDPEFSDFVHALYGEMLDAEVIWEDVFGKGLTKEQRDRREAQIGLASNYVGLAAGTAGTGAAYSAYSNARREAKGLPPKEAGKVKAKVGRLVPKNVARHVTPKRAAGAALGLQVANVGGDVIANRVLGRSAKVEKRMTIHKATQLNALVRGVLAQTKNAGRSTHLPKAAHLPGETPVKHTGQLSMFDDAGHTAPGVAAHDTKAAKTSAEISRDAKQQQVGRAIMNPGEAARSAGGKIRETTMGSGRRQLATVGAVGVVGSARGKRKGQAKAYNQMTEPMYKSDSVTFAGEFSKFDDDKRVAFGWASVVEKDGMPVVDRQGDYMSVDDVETAAYQYVLKSRKGGDMHARITSELGEDSPKHVADLIESVVFTDEKIAKMGLPDNFPRGWWIGMKVNDEDTWQEVKKGNRTGFSIHGKGKRQDTTLDSVVGYR